MTGVLEAGVSEFHRYMDEELNARTDVVWRVAGKNKPTKATPNGEDEQFWRENGPKWLKMYQHWRIKHPNLRVAKFDGTPAIEMSINVQVPNSDIILKGYIDRVFEDTKTGNLHIIDLKSGKSDQDSPLQLAFYRLGIKQQFDVDVRYGSFYSARKGDLDAQYDLDQFPPSLVSRWIRNMSRSIELGDFTPNISRNCSWCGMKSHCYVWNPEIVRPEDDSDLFDYFD